jgi:cytochrome b
MEKSRFFWDLPIRITHWLFVTCVAVSWWSTEERYMDVHRWSGYVLLALLVFRIYWGFAGTSAARFADFVHSPRTVLERLRDARAARKHGHTPWGGWSVLTMLSLLGLQVGLGLFVTDVDGIESGPLSYLVSFETGRMLAQAHEVVFNVLLGVITLHIAAIGFYFARGENLLPRMLRAARTQAPPDGAVSAWRVWPGIALAGLVVWLVTRG